MGLKKGYLLRVLSLLIITLTLPVCILALVEENVKPVMKKPFTMSWKTAKAGIRLEPAPKTAQERKF